MKDIVAIGEILIDLTQTGENGAGVPLFAANPGGAPANLAVAAAKLGADTAFIGKAGADAYGRFLRQTLKDNGVNIEGLHLDAAHPTTLAVVSVNGEGERSFSFYRDRTADVMLSPEELPKALLQDTRFFHFGSVSLTAEPSRPATLQGVAAAKAAGAIITYDPNYRAALWTNEVMACEAMKSPLPLVDILKISDEELPLLAGTADCEEGSARLAELGISLVLVTLGPDGAFYRFHGAIGIVPGVPCTVGDTNGAGDTFFGALLSRLSQAGCTRKNLQDLPLSELEEAIAYANQAASLTTSRYGAIPAMPDRAEVEAKIESARSYR